MSATEYFQRLERPALDQQDKYYSYRYFNLQGYFFASKTERKTLQRKQLEKICPKPLLTAFANGNVHFPYEQKHEILRQIAHDVKSGSVMYWNQIAYDVPGQGCRLAMDIDTKRVVRDSEILVLAQELRVTLQKYFTDFTSRPIHVFVAKCGPRIKNKRMITGIHIVCHVKVSIAQAKQIVFGYKMQLKHCHKLDLKDIEVDSNIYKERSNQMSLRMVYSNKVEDCPMCLNKTAQRQTCQLCERDGQVISRFTYEPMLVVDGRTGQASDELFLAHTQDFENLVCTYSIWPEPEDQRTDYAKPTNHPPYTLEQEHKMTGNKRKRGQGKGAKRVALKNNPVTYQLVEEYINSLTYNSQQLWKEVYVNKVELTENKLLAFINVKGVGCTTCPYAQKSHNSNTVYFQITRRGIMSVGCHSAKLSQCSPSAQDRIKFELPGHIRNKIFGISGPPSLYKPFGVDLEPKPFNSKDFTRRKAPRAEYHSRAKNSEAQQRRIQTMTEFYNNLGKK